MTAQASVSDSFTFVGGLNTEGGYFITPENSYKEGVNVVPKLDGSIERRNGLDYEPIFQLYDAQITADQKDLWAFSTGVWSTVAGNGNLDFFVVQTGPTLHFYNGASGTVSATKKSFTVDLESYRAPNNSEIAGTGVCSYAPTYGRLIVTSQNTIPIIITYNPSNNTISVATVDIRIRDFKGKPLITSAGVTVPITDEKTQAEWEALGININDVIYNLNNQGWKTAQIDAYKAASGGKFPSNTKSWIFGKDPNDDFSVSVLNKQDFGNSPAPKGSFIIDPFTPTTFRPKVCAFFAGRAWYAGIPSSELLGTVFFSQVLDDVSKVGDCYQTNDPTSEVLSDLQDNDGGSIEIPEAGEIVGLQAVGRGIMVFATNGVWFVSGIDQGFTAANYSVDRITNVGCIGAKSIVDIEDAVVYWSTSGIYAIMPSNSIEYTARNVSDTNIKSFFQDIAVLGKLYVEGAYNASDKTVYWIYSDELSATTSSGRYNKDTVLAFDLQLQSWYWFDLDTTVGVVPVSIEVTKETNTEGETYNVLAGTDNVIVGSDNVIATVPTVTGTRKIYKVLSLHPVTNNNYSVTFADFENTRDSSTKFKDWYSFNTAGAEKEAYFITGYNMGGVGPARAQTGQYLTVFMKRTETAFDINANPINESSCIMQARWDFTDNAGAGKWANEVQVYRQLRPFFVAGAGPFDDGYPLVISKNKLRGRGKAVQFKFASEVGKDMKIVGWTGTFVGNTNV
jgi:hypothetical protein